MFGDNCVLKLEDQTVF